MYRQVMMGSKWAGESGLGEEKRMEMERDNMGERRERSSEKEMGKW